MKKILFLIHDLGHGGAEKVLVNLVNNMDPEQFDISVTVLFAGGVNEQYLAPHIHFRALLPREFRGNSHVMKLFSPKVLHRWAVREHYDIEVSYLEGPSVRIASGCEDPDTKLISWIHCTMHSPKETAVGFRSIGEARDCYGKMDAMMFVSRSVRDAFLAHCPYTGPTDVLYNTNESRKILELAAEDAELPGHTFRWCGVGRLIPVKGFDRMIRIQKRLTDEGYPAHLYILGEGAQRAQLEALTADLGVARSVTFLGYQANPYKFVAKCSLFVCASFAEGFSTAATESLILGTPVCTVEVSGMKELLGEQNEWGVITENSEDALCAGIKRLLDDPALLAHYKETAALRGKSFSTAATVRAVEEMLNSLSGV